LLFYHHAGVRKLGYEVVVVVVVAVAVDVSKWVSV